MALPVALLKVAVLGMIFSTVLPLRPFGSAAAAWWKAALLAIVPALVEVRSAWWKERPLPAASCPAPGAAALRILACFAPDYLSLSAGPAALVV